MDKIKSIMARNKIALCLKEYVIITLGAVAMGAGVYFFKIPNGFATGGVSGIGTILGKIIPAITPSMWIMIINCFLLICGFVFLGKDNTIRTVYCSLVFSFVTLILENFFQLKSPLTDQPLLELIYAMLLTSLGSAMIFNSGASSGGTDIVALILKKYSHINVGQALLITDFIIAATSFYIFDIKTGLFSMLGLFAKAFLVDSIIENINSCKYFTIITTKPEEVNDYIINNLHHGATFSTARGSYTNTDKIIIHTVCRRAEAFRLRRFVKSIDPKSFIIITTTSEIIGRGFRGVV